MMTVKEYASELGISVQEVLEKAKELGSKVTSGTDMLSEDDVIMLDNAINVISSDSEMDFHEVDVLDEAVENTNSITIDMNSDLDLSMIGLEVREVIKELKNM